MWTAPLNCGTFGACILNLNLPPLHPRPGPYGGTGDKVWGLGVSRESLCEHWGARVLAGGESRSFPGEGGAGQAASGALCGP